MRILFILIIFISGCASTSVTRTRSADNKYVLILSTLLQDHLRKTDGQNINLVELLRNDTLRRISNTFEKVELKPKGGYISVYYKFSKSRNSNGIELSDKEKDQSDSFRWTEKELKNQYDGEIRFRYGEKFYKLIKIVTNV